MADPNASESESESWRRVSAELGVGPLPGKSEDDPARRNVQPRFQVAAAGSTRRAGAIVSRPPEVRGWRLGVDADFRSAEEVAHDAAEEAALEQSRLDGTLDQMCAANGWGSEARFLQSQRASGWVPTPKAFPRRAAWAFEPDTRLRFVIDENPEDLAKYR